VAKKELNELPVQAPTPTRKRRAESPTAAERDDRLLQYALEAFLDGGLSATIDDISARAKISKRTIYQQYKDKRDLFVAATRKAISERTVTALALDTHLPLDELLHRLAVRTIRLGLTAEFRTLARLAFRASEDFPELLEPLTAGPRLDLVDPLARHLETLSTKGEIRAIDHFSVAELFVAHIFNYLNSFTIRRLPDPSDVEVEQWLTTVVDLYIQGLHWRRKS